MSKNWKFGQVHADVTLALEVPEGARAGDVVQVGDSGQLAYMITDRATADGPNAPGLSEGYASVRLLPAQGVIEVEVDEAIAAGDPVYATADAEGVTYGAAGDYLIGRAVEPDGQAPAAGRAFVYLGNITPVAAGD